MKHFGKCESILCYAPPIAAHSPKCYMPFGLEHPLFEQHKILSFFRFNFIIRFSMRIWSRQKRLIYAVSCKCRAFFVYWRICLIIKRGRIGELAHQDARADCSVAPHRQWGRVLQRPVRLRASPHRSIYAVSCKCRAFFVCINKTLYDLLLTNKN